VSWHLFSPAVLAEQLLPPTTAPRYDLLILLPAIALISFVAAGFGLWAFRRIRDQHARAELLAEDLFRIREETRRRLNFLNAISHDLRTPLNGITLQTHIIDRAIDAQDADTLRLAVGGIRASSGLAAEILDALLQYARVDVDPVVTSSVRLKELMQQTAEPFRAAAEDKTLAFSLFVDDGVTLDTDRDKLQRILANLLDNAVKFTPHGSITVRARRAGPGDAPPPAPHHTDGTRPPAPRPAPPGAVIEVADTGDGIAPEHRDKVFREFFQAHNPSRDARLGLGLGLVVAERLAHQLGGRLECQSELRKGSTFRLTLPAVLQTDD
jgi:signal transduction histidine kinase